MVFRSRLRAAGCMSSRVTPSRQQHIHTSDESARLRRPLLNAAARIDHIDTVAVRLRRRRESTASPAGNVSSTTPNTIARGLVGV
jgi:hypothetical protein